MQISEKMLLSSAEGILKERREDSRGRRGQITASSGRSEKPRTDSLNQDVLQVHLLKLQANLNSVQNEYSREQARQNFLSRSPDQISDQLKYDDQPLFPELKEGFSLNQISEKVDIRLLELDRSLKGLQVEMENLYALNFNQLPIPGIDPGDILRNPPVRDLDPSRVAKLTRG